MEEQSRDYKYMSSQELLKIRAELVKEREEHEESIRRNSGGMLWLLGCVLLSIMSPIYGHLLSFVPSVVTDVFAALPKGIQITLGVVGFGAAMMGSFLRCLFKMMN